MKNAILTSIFVLTLFYATAQTRNAARYNDRIIDVQHKITSRLARFAGSIGRTSLENLHKEKDEIEFALGKAISKVSNMNGFQGDTQLRDASIVWFKLTKKILEKDFDEVMHILAKKEKSEEEKRDLKELMDKLIVEEDEIIINFEKIQEEFAQHHGLELIDVPVKL